MPRPSDCWQVLRQKQMKLIGGKQMRNTSAAHPGSAEHTIRRKLSNEKRAVSA